MKFFKKLRQNIAKLLLVVLCAIAIALALAIGIQAGLVLVGYCIFAYIIIKLGDLSEFK